MNFRQRAAFTWMLALPAGGGGGGGWALAILVRALIGLRAWVGLQVRLKLMEQHVQPCFVVCTVLGRSWALALGSLVLIKLRPARRTGRA